MSDGADAALQAAHEAHQRALLELRTACRTRHLLRKARAEEQARVRRVFATLWRATLACTDARRRGLLAQTSGPHAAAARERAARLRRASRRLASIAQHAWCVDQEQRAAAWQDREIGAVARAIAGTAPSKPPRGLVVDDAASVRALARIARAMRDFGEQVVKHHTSAAASAPQDLLAALRHEGDERGDDDAKDEQHNRD